jgi:hypothetical protein
MHAGKAGLSSTSQQLQLLQQVQQAQHLHAVMRHIQHRYFPFHCPRHNSVQLYNMWCSPVAGIHEFDVAAAAAGDARALKAAVQVRAYGVLFSVSVSQASDVFTSCS